MALKIKPARLHRSAGRRQMGGGHHDLPGPGRHSCPAMQRDAHPARRPLRAHVIKDHLIEGQPHRIGPGPIHRHDPPLHRAVIAKAKHRSCHQMRPQTRQRQTAEDQTARHHQGAQRLRQEPHPQKQHRGGRPRRPEHSGLRLLTQAKENPDPDPDHHRHPGKEMPALRQKHRADRVPGPCPERPRARLFHSGQCLSPCQRPDRQTPNLCPTSLPKG